MIFRLRWRVENLYKKAMVGKYFKIFQFIREEKKIIINNNGFSLCNRNCTLVYFFCSLFHSQITGGEYILQYPIVVIFRSRIYIKDKIVKYTFHFVKICDKYRIYLLPTFPNLWFKWMNIMKTYFII